jgi:hypothetical protein
LSNTKYKQQNTSTKAQDNKNIEAKYCTGGQHMTLIETTYSELREAGLVTTREQFSTQFVGRNSNWYSYQLHVGRDFSVSAAVHCLRAIKQLEDAVTMQGKQRRLLAHTAQLLCGYLREQHLALADA